MMVMPCARGTLNRTKMLPGQARSASMGLCSAASHFSLLGEFCTSRQVLGTLICLMPVSVMVSTTFWEALLHSASGRK